MRFFKPKRRHEAVDPTPTSLSVKFQRPPTLAEQIARHMAAHARYQESLQAQDEDDLERWDDPDFDEDDEIRSPHELVYDEQLNREMPRYQKELLDKQRLAFDIELAKKQKEDIERRVMARKVQETVEEKPTNTKPELSDGK